MQAKKPSMISNTGTSIDIHALRKRARRRVTEAKRTSTTGDNTQTASESVVHRLKRRKVEEKSRNETDLTLSGLARKFGQGKNIKDIENTIAALVASEHDKETTYSLQRHELLISLQKGFTSLGHLVPVMEGNA